MGLWVLLIVLMCGIWYSRAEKCSIKCGIALRQGRRQEMEDRAVCKCLLNNPYLSFTGVYDGHEGSRVSQLLAEELDTRLKANLLGKERKGHLTMDGVQLAAKAALTSINEEFLSQAKENSWSDGSTAVFAIILEGFLLLGNVGNSRAIVCKKADSCKDLLQRTSGGTPESLVLFQTQDHTPERLDERNRIVESGNTVEHRRGTVRLNGELEVSRALGDLFYLDKGLIADPEFYHMPLANLDGFLVLVSDGVLEVMTSETVCQLAENARLSCKNWKPTPPPDPPIALGGIIAPAQHPNFDGQEGVRKTPPEKSEILHEVENCADCRNDRALQESFSMLHGSAMTLEQNIAHRIVEEAYSRVSMDNIAVTALDLSLLQGKNVSPSGPVLGLFGGYASVQSPDKSYQYRLLDKVAVIPSGSSQHCHVHWDSTTPPQPHNLQDSSGIIPINESWDDVVLSKRSLAIIQSTDIALQRLECAAPLFNSQNELVSSGMCPIQFAIEASALGLVQALGSLPLIPAPDEEAHHDQNLDSVGDGQGNYEEVLEQYAHYRLQGKFAAGSFGEVWRAVPRDPDGLEVNSTGDVLYIMKRLMMEKGEHVVLSGLREMHFGELFQGRAADAEVNEGIMPEGYNHLARFVESFEIQPGPELWLVFRDEGESLHSVMYNEIPSQRGASFSGPRIVKPGSWWWKMRKSVEGEVMFKSILHQLLLGVECIHAANATHRDIKPENILLRGARNLDEDSHPLEVRIIDFGSALDNYTLHNMYGHSGPTEDEETQEYSPPEARFGRLDYSKLDSTGLQAYDMWSIGVVWLEYILGTPHVFHLPERTRALLIHQLNLSTLPELEQERALLLRAMMEFCIYPPSQQTNRFTKSKKHVRSNPNTNSKRDSSRLESYSADNGSPVVNEQRSKSDKIRGSINEDVDNIPNASIVSWSCSEAALLKLIKARDPAGHGLPSRNALSLLMSLLAWDSENRITAREALSSQYFQE